MMQEEEDRIILHDSVPPHLAGVNRDAYRIVLISTTVKPFGIWFLHYERPKNQNTSTVRATAEAGWEEAKNTAETGQTRNINDSEA